MSTAPAGGTPGRNPQEARSVWATTARPQPAFPALARELRVDVAVVGAGFTGLTAAHHLARAGVSCAVIDAHEPGWGASGRNGGMAVMRYKPAWTGLARRYGEEAARRYHRLLLEAVDALEATVAERGIACGFARYGHVTAANGRSALAALGADVAWLAGIGDRVPRMLDAGETAALTGTRCYLGGLLDPRAAGIHPLDYVRGLAAALARVGVPVHGGTPALALRAETDRVVVDTPGGELVAQRVLLATNAYSAMREPSRELARRVVPVSTSVITTAPLPGATIAAITPQRHLVSDTRHLLNYFRIAPGNRVLFGGRGSLTGSESPEVYAGLERRLVQTFPELAGVAIDHRWSGMVAVTLDDLPHFGCLGPRVAYALGYGGRGVALTALLGDWLARWAIGEAVDPGAMGEAGLRRIPLHGMRIPAMKAVAGWYRLLDALKL